MPTSQDVDNKIFLYFMALYILADDIVVEDVLSLDFENFTGNI